jgi:hypothetical protein
VLLKGKKKTQRKVYFLFKTVIFSIFFTHLTVFGYVFALNIFVGLALVVFALTLFALIVYDLVSICCIRMANSDFIIFELDISDDE